VCEPDVCGTALLTRRAVSSANTLLDTSAFQERVATAALETTPGTDAAFHVLDWGILVSGLIESITHGPLADAISSFLLEPLQLQDDIQPCAARAAEFSMVARVDNMFMSQSVGSASRAHLDVTSSELQQLADMNPLLDERALLLSIASSMISPQSTASQLTSVNLLDPCIYNLRQLKKHLFPPLGLHGTAFGVAKVLAHVFAATQPTVQQGLFSHGLQMFPDSDAIGMLGMGGSLAVYYPKTQAIVCILTNTMTVDKTVVTKVYSTISESLGVTPVALT
jgi:hypothetical protein